MLAGNLEALKTCVIFFKLLFCSSWIILNSQKRVEIKWSHLLPPSPPNSLALSYQRSAIYATEAPIKKIIDLVETFLYSQLIASLSLHSIGNHCNKFNDFLYLYIQKCDWYNWYCFTNSYKWCHTINVILNFSLTYYYCRDSFMWIHVALVQSFYLLWLHSNYDYITISFSILLIII